MDRDITAYFGRFVGGGELQLNAARDSKYSVAV
jgi:hypothetical protein